MIIRFKRWIFSWICKHKAKKRIPKGNSCISILIVQNDNETVRYNKCPFLKEINPDARCLLDRYSCTLKKKGFNYYINEWRFPIKICNKKRPVPFKINFKKTTQKFHPDSDKYKEAFIESFIIATNNSYKFSYKLKYYIRKFIKIPRIRIVWKHI